MRRSERLKRQTVHIGVFGYRVVLVVMRFSVLAISASVDSMAQYCVTAN
jgi:hypothetical protein